MNILIAFYSESGNTRKVAEAMASGLSSAPDTIVDLRHIEEVNPARWENYDLIFIGTPAISWTVAEPVKKSIRGLPTQHLSGFQARPFRDLWRSRYPVLWRVYRAYQILLQETECRVPG